jgi:hypothetical protein
LLQALDDSDSHVQDFTAEALRKVDGQVLAPHTMALLSKALDPAKPPHVRAGAAKGIEVLPTAVVAPHLAGLLAMLGNVDWPQCRRGMAEERVVQRVVASMPADAFGKMLTLGGGGTEIVLKTAVDRVSSLPADRRRSHAPLLMSLLRDPRAGVREYALRTLQRLGPSELARQHPALLLLGLLDPVAEVRRTTLETLCSLPVESLAPHAAEVLRMLWDFDELVRETAMDKAWTMLDNFQAPALKEQLRRAAVEACTGDGVLGTMRRGA